MGDKVLIKQRKTTVKPPWNPESYTLPKVKGSQITASKGREESEGYYYDVQTAKGETVGAEGKDISKDDRCGQQGQILQIKNLFICRLQTG